MFGCKVSDAFTIYDKQSVLEQYEQFLQSRGVPCEFMFYNEDRCELFVPKSERERALNLLTRYKKTHSEKGFETEKTMNNKPKR